MSVRFNLFSPIMGNRGYPILGRNLAKACASNGADVTLFDNSFDDLSGIEDVQLTDLIMKQFDASVDVPSVNLSVGSPRHMAAFGGSHRIGYTLIETTRIPDTWVKALNSLDGAWTTSKHGKKAFEDSGVKHDIAIIPGGVDACAFNEKKFEDSKIVGYEDWFMFLTLGKWEPRKNFPALIRAFQDEFHGEKAAILIACHNPHIQAFNPFERLWAENITNKELPAVLIGPSNMTQDQLIALYSSCDAFVLATRGEGWCLPALEAMSCSLPAIMTGWSGHMDFLEDTKNGFAVPVKQMVPAEDHMWKDFLVGEWAEPDMEQFVDRMRYLFDNRQACRRMGLNAARIVREKWTWDDAARKAIRALERL